MTSTLRGRELCTATPRSIRHDPLSSVRTLCGSNDPGLAGNEEPKDTHRKPDPLDIGYRGYPLPAREVRHAEFRILPKGPGVHSGEFRTKFVIAPDSRIASQRFIHSGNQRVFIILPS